MHAESTQVRSPLQSLELAQLARQTPESVGLSAHADANTAVPWVAQIAPEHAELSVHSFVHTPHRHR